MSTDDYDVPLTIKSKISRNDYDNKKIELVYRSNQKLKLQFPVHEDQEEQEFFKLLRKVQTAVVRHDLWILTNESTVYDTIQQCLGGDALDTWVEIFVNKDKASWTTYLEEYVERLIGKDAYENQRDYIKEVKRPKDTSVKNGYYN